MAHKSTYILLGILVIIGLVFFTPSKGICSWDFQHSIWGPAELLVYGQPPYQLNPPYGPYIAPWWPQIIGVNFWMGWLPCWTAAKLWLAIELAGLGFSIWLLNYRKKPTPRQLGLMLLVVFLFPPVYTHIHLGQFSLLFITLMVMTAFTGRERFPSAKQLSWVSLLAVLGAAKPQLTVLIYPGIIAATWKRQGMSGLARLLGASLGWLAICLIPLFAFYPGWISGFMEVTRYNLNAGWNLPTPFIQLYLHLGITGLFIWLLFFFSSLALSIYLWVKKGERVGLIWTMALTPLVTTYCSSWDFTLLLPLFFWQFLNYQSGLSRGILISGMFLVDIWQVVPRLGKNDIPDSSQWWIPPALITVFVLSMLVERWKESQFAINDKNIEDLEEVD